ncbi:hypothetical protein LPJ66_007595 [Kickxella alabastrina]|uniref:Uncharacterized protein n=1 Tax=Kickxella alabastrina TaxID=61397 RepID=A0ACC1ICD3_9FUNG|nr:hypothetical protein LPJ66_007595 [Kickxella alabastrina]
MQQGHPLQRFMLSTPMELVQMQRDIISATQPLQLQTSSNSKHPTNTQIQPPPVWPSYPMNTSPVAQPLLAQLPNTADAGPASTSGTSGTTGASASVSAWPQFPQSAQLSLNFLTQYAQLPQVTTSICSSQSMMSPSCPDFQLLGMFSPMDATLSLSPQLPFAETGDINTIAATHHHHHHHQQSSLVTVPEDMSALTNSLLGQITNHGMQGVSWETVCRSLPQNSAESNRNANTPDHLTGTHSANSQGTMSATPGSITAGSAMTTMSTIHKNVGKRAGGRRSFRADEPAGLAHMTYFNVDQFYEAQRLIRRHGENWLLIGQIMGIRGGDLAENWRGYSVHSRITREWTASETEILALCRQLGIPCRMASRIIGSKLPLQCRRKTLKKPETSSVEEQEKGADQADLQEKGPDSVSHVAWTTGHTNVLHKTQLNVPEIDNIRISECVEMQCLSGGPVNWAVVSQQTGLPVKKCLENSHCDSGKQPWIYSPETFRWDMAETLRTLINEFYPAPEPINFAAVSNFLWVSMPDCITMYGLLCGRFDWNASALEELARLSALGWSDMQIARRFSPTMAENRVAQARLMWRAQQAHFSLSSSSSLSLSMSLSLFANSALNTQQQDQDQDQQQEQQQQLTMLPAELDAPAISSVQNLVNTYVEDRSMEITQLLDSVRSALSAYNQVIADKCALILICAHPLGASKMSRRAHRKPKLTAPRPSTELSNIGSNVVVVDPAFYSAKWTDEETELLVRYAVTHGADRNWRHFADIVATKTPTQCANKYRSLRRYKKIAI